MAYDSFGRLFRHTSATGALTVHSYNTQGQLETTMDHAGKSTTSSYYPANHQNAGMLRKTTNPANEVTENIYNERGELVETTGNGTYRVTYGYNSYGERETMRTYRSAESTGDLTEWTYDPATGLLLEKTDAATKSTTYTHDSAGRFATRIWARSGTITTTYGYNPFGDLTSTDYSDDTPDVTIVPNRLGQPQEVTDASGTRTLTYHPVTEGVDKIEYVSGGLLPSIELDYTWDTSSAPRGTPFQGADQPSNSNMMMRADSKPSNPGASPTPIPTSMAPTLSAASPPRTAPTQSSPAPSITTACAASSGSKTRTAPAPHSPATATCSTALAAAPAPPARTANGGTTNSTPSVKSLLA
jgi:YD repeat-containing protein